MPEKLETWHYRSAEAFGLEYDYLNSVASLDNKA